MVRVGVRGKVRVRGRVRGRGRGRGRGMVRVSRARPLPALGRGGDSLFPVRPD